MAERRIAARLGRGQSVELRLGGRHFDAELVVPGVEVRHEVAQVLGGQGFEPGTSGLRAQLDHEEHTEQDGHQGERHLVAAGAQAVAHGAGLGDGGRGGAGRA